MGNTAKRLSTFSDNGYQPDFQLSEADFFELQSELKSGPFSEDARQELIKICRRYLRGRHVERKVRRLSDAQKMWAKARPHLIAIVEMGFGQFPPAPAEKAVPSPDEPPVPSPRSDEWRLVEELIYEGFETARVPLTEKDLEPPKILAERNRKEMSPLDRS